MATPDSRNAEGRMPVSSCNTAAEDASTSRVKPGLVISQRAPSAPLKSVAYRASCPPSTVCRSALSCVAPATRADVEQGSKWVRAAWGKAVSNGRGRGID
eukprot:scaffold71881_cov64-Phaeocystis_antarctica.AAC.4